MYISQVPARLEGCAKAGAAAANAAIKTSDLAIMGFLMRFMELATIPILSWGSLGLLLDLGWMGSPETWCSLA
jgi:hypothetical protein